MAIERFGFGKPRRLQNGGRNHEPEQTAAAGGFSDADFATHRAHQALGNGQTQTRSGEPARIAGIGLNKLFEDRAALVARHTDPCVKHLEADELAFAAISPAHGYPNSALFGELYSI